MGTINNIYTTDLMRDGCNQDGDYEYLERKIRVKFSVRNGRLDGVIRHFLRKPKRDSILWEDSYRRGRLDGTTRVFYPGGKCRYSIGYSKGVMYRFTYLYKNGQTALMLWYKDGYPIFPAVRFKVDGTEASPIKAHQLSADFESRQFFEQICTLLQEANSQASRKARA